MIMRVRHTQLPLVRHSIEAGTKDVMTEPSRIILRPIALVLHEPSPDLYVLNITHRNRIVYATDGHIPAGMFGQLIPPESRVKLDILTVHFGEQMSIRVFNRGHKAVAWAGYFECLCTEEGPL